jgi:uncharacterized membrane protein
MKVEESVVIHRPPSDVFAYLAVRSHDAVWMASVVESAWLDADGADASEPIGVGRRGRMVMRLPGRRAVFIDEVTEYDPGRRVAHRTIEGPIPLRTACLCDPLGDGGCRTTVVGEVDHLPGGVFGRLAAPVFTRMVRRGFRADLARLKTILESDVGSPGSASLQR